MDHTTLGRVYQEVITDFAEMEPTSLDQLEQKTLDAIYRIGSCLGVSGIR